MTQKSLMQLYIMADAHPFHRFVTRIEKGTGIDQQVLATAVIESNVVAYSVASIEHALQVHEQIFDYLTQTEWYFDDKQVGFCTSGCRVWSQTTKDYVEYVDPKTDEEFDELLQQYQDKQV